MATTDHIQAILDRMPHEPGVYQHFDGDGKLLYIGKAKNLKKRVASYFTKQDHNGKTRLLVKKIRDVQWIVTCLLYTSPSPRDMRRSRMPSSA